MCMLTAMVPRANLSDSDLILGKLLFTSLILNNAKSNKDGFGLASTNQTTFKTTKCASEVLYEGECITAVTNAIVKPMIGHVRTTSTGRNAKNGSHPFFVGPLALAHNGTFTNYKELLKENVDISSAINDKDPVDSNVFAHLLAKVKGKKSLTSDHIETTIKEIEGSYAVLIAEDKKDFIWVIRGINPLYLAAIGPYWIVNTNKFCLTDAAQNTANTLKLLFGLNLEVSEVSEVSSYGVYKLSTSGLIKEATLPIPVVTSSTNTWGAAYSKGSSNYRPSTQKGLPGLSTPTAITRANLAVEITSIPGISYCELGITAQALCRSSWWDTEVSDLLIIRETLEVLSSSNYSVEKELIWKLIYKVVGDSPYEHIDNIMTLVGARGEVLFPYFLHKIGELEALLKLVRGGDNVIIS